MFLCYLIIFISCTTLWTIVLFTLIIIQLNMLIHLLILVTLLQSAKWHSWWFCKSVTTSSDRLIMFYAFLTSWIQALRVNYFCHSIWACMIVSSGFLPMTFSTSVFHGASANAEYVACPTVLIAFCFRSCVSFYHWLVHFVCELVLLRENTMEPLNG